MPPKKVAHKKGGKKPSNNSAAADSNENTINGNSTEAADTDSAVDSVTDSVHLLTTNGKNHWTVLLNETNSKDLIIPNLSLTVKETGKELLVESPLRLIYGHRYGLIGHNGVGKSLLFQQLHSKSVQLASGSTMPIPAHLNIVYLRQELEGDEIESKTPLQFLIESDSRIQKLRIREKELIELTKKITAGDSNTNTTNPSNSISIEAELTDVYEALSLLDADSMPSRAAEILTDMGFTQFQQNNPIKFLSGGQRCKVSFASVIIQDFDILLMDEPSNHLDVSAQKWLISYIRSNSDIASDDTLDEDDEDNEVAFQVSSTVHSRKGLGSIVMISHDVGFLNALCTDIIHFHHQRFDYYPGNYHTFLRITSNQNSFLANAQANLDAQRAHIQESITHLKKQQKSSGNSVGMIGSRNKKLLRMGLERDAQGKKYQLQIQGQRVGSANATALGYKTGQHTSLVEGDEREFVFKFPSVEWPGTSMGEPLVELKGIKFDFLPVKVTEAGGNKEDSDSDEEKDSADEENKESEKKEEKKSINSLFAPKVPLFYNLSFSICFGDRIGLLGCNGLGKSTLISLLTGHMKLNDEQNSSPDAINPPGPFSALTSDSMKVNRPIESTLFNPINSGLITYCRGVRIAYFTQFHLQTLPEQLTPLECFELEPYKSMCEKLRNGMDFHQFCRNRLGMYGLIGKIIPFTRIKVLSGGQKTRLMLSVLSLLEPHLWVLDEIQNHLDLSSLSFLSTALQEFPGAIILISHNRELLSDVCTQYWLMEKAKSIKPKKGVNKKKKKNPDAAEPEIIMRKSRVKLTKYSGNVHDYYDSLEI